MTTRREATSCGAGLPLGYAVANRKLGPRAVVMRPSAIACGHRRSQFFELCPTLSEVSA